MKIEFPKEQIHNPLDILRKAGYQHFIDPNTNKESFILRLTSGYYPRFHLYLKEKDGNIIFDLHLDQKKPSYAGSNMHGGEYDGPTVEKEMNRIDGWIRKVCNIPSKEIVKEEKVPQTASESAPKEPEIQHKKLDQQQESNDLFGGIF